FGPGDRGSLSARRAGAGAEAVALPEPDGARHGFPGLPAVSPSPDPVAAQPPPLSAEADRPGAVVCRWLPRRGWVAAAGDGAGGVRAERGGLQLALPDCRATRTGGEWPEGSDRVNRGGGWNNNGTNCQAANRNRNTPTNRNNNLGFRLARAPRGPRRRYRTEPAALPFRPGFGPGGQK